MIRLAVICPLGRDNARNVQRNWERQKYKGAHLIVVENGAGLGSCERAGFKPSQVLQCFKAHPGAAKNAGLEFLFEETQANHWTTFDDDDYYGPEYLQEVVEAFDQGHDIVGKSEHYCRLSNGCVVLFECRGENREVQIVQGPTLGSVLWPDMPRFDEVEPWGEDQRWQQDARTQGRTTWATSRKNFCYMRHGPKHGHAYPMRDDQLLAYSRGELFDVGAWNRELFTREKPHKTPLARPKLEFDDHPAIQLGRRRMIEKEEEQKRAADEAQDQLIREYWKERAAAKDTIRKYVEVDDDAVH